MIGGRESGDGMRLRHFMGIDTARHAGTPSVVEPVTYDTRETLNAHTVICGMSGTGKSYQCIQMLTSAAAAGIEVDVMDVHEELGDIPGAVSCKYSQATQLGFNPLVLDTDRHTGGVTRKANEIIGLVSEVAHLGIKQQACLRSLVIDTYAAAGIFQDSPGTWRRREITEAQHASIVSRRAYAELREFYPTLGDLQSYARRKLQSLTMGGGDMSTAAFEELQKCLKALNKSQGNYGKARSPEDKQKLEVAVEQAKAKYNEASLAWSASLQTGREFDDIIKYDSPDVLKGLMDRLEELNSSGIFQANRPDFRGSNVRVHAIKALSNDQQQLFVRMRLQSIFDRRKAEGATETGVELRHVIFLDEGHKFFGKADDDIVNVIAREARKFGIGLWVASQSPADFPKSFLSNVGMTMLLGIHPMYWTPTLSMLRTSERTLQGIRAKEVMAVRMQTEGQANPPFRHVAVPNEKTIENKACKAALAYKRTALRVAA